MSYDLKEWSDAIEAFHRLHPAERTMIVNAMCNPPKQRKRVGKYQLVVEGWFDSEYWWGHTMFKETTYEKRYVD